MTAPRSKARYWAVLIALVLAACTQLPNEADVGIGTDAYASRDAAPYAALYKPYAQMSALAYADPQFLTAVGGCPDAKKLRDPNLVDATHSAQDNAQLADWLDDLQRGGWGCVRSHSGAVDCPRNVDCAQGLDATAWRRKDCGEAVIAFRGSDKDDRGDWASNLRWLVHGSTSFDQYDQVKAAISRAVTRISQEGCRPKRIITTGHSLGGGLAQQAAFAEARIDYVYAFDPSPVVGLFNVAAKKRMKATEKLGIDRVYESGEVLALSRSLASGAFATSQCQPRIRTVRFATLAAGNRRERHRITGLTQGLVELAKTAPTGAPLPYGFDDARDCDFDGVDEDG